MDDVLQKLADAKTADDVKSVLDSCAYELKAKDGEVEDEPAEASPFGGKAKAPPFGKKSFDDELRGEIDSAMKDGA